MLVAVCLLLLTGCAAPSASEYGKWAEALDASAWESSQWISVVDAPVVTGKTTDNKNNRAADGASWFVSVVKNEQQVVAAKWMTTGLGVYEIYVNGKPIGKEFMKPGYTHYAKTRQIGRAHV